MSERTEQPTHWRRWLLACWAAFVVYMLYYKWNGIHWFSLGDTDDNMRFAQVQALLNGQGWYDLRQHRIDPPNGISVHWSRLVDLPIAALTLILRPLIGGQEAARWACAIAPMLAIGPALYGLMLTVRRLVDRWSFFLAAAILACANTTLLMWMPLRIDHHGWQLASLIVAVSGMADGRGFRGGLTAGFATAFSLTIGLELLPYLAVVGALILLWWVIEGAQARRLQGYGISLAAGTAFGYLVFGSFDNAQMLCDALTPVYLSTLVAAGAILFALGALPFGARWQRIAAAIAACAAIGGFYAGVFPQCLGRPERLSPEADKLWFSHIKEAKPLYQHGWRIALPTLSLSVIGVIGAVWSFWRARGTEKAIPWALVFLLSLFSALLLFWQTRAGPGSQLMGVIGATAMGWPLMNWTLQHRNVLIRVFGTVGVFLLVSGSFSALIVQNAPEHKSAYRVKVDQASRRCPTLPALKPIADLPPATILTFIDLGPRLIAVTHHDAVAGPYHRAGDAILDVQHSFRNPDPEFAHDVMRRHGASLLLICPGFPESTVYLSEAPKGFYAQILHNQVPAWLQPMKLPENSPYRLWRRIN